MWALGRVSSVTVTVFLNGKSSESMGEDAVNTCHGSRRKEGST